MRNQASMADFFGEVVDKSPLLIYAISWDGTVRYVNQAVLERSGLPLEAWVGTSALEHLHPDDLERAMSGLATVDESVPFPQRVTHYRAGAADGSWIPMEVMSVEVSIDGQSVLALYGRETTYDVTVDKVLRLLTADQPAEQVLSYLFELVPWKEWRSRLALAWRSGGEDRVVSTELAPELADGRDDGSPWAECRSTGQDVRSDADGLDQRRRAQADAAGVSHVQVSLLDWGGSEPAVLTVWTSGGGALPELLAAGVAEVRPLIELVLRWSARTEQMAAAARTDELTGLANRREFFARVERGLGPGAVLYCDLDDFKPVNDLLGHAAGDEVLRVIAARVRAVVGESDLVARLGGDEIVVLAPGRDEAEAEALAERVRDAVSTPIELDAGSATVGVSVGVAVDDALGERTIERADAALNAHKQRRPGPRLRSTPG